MFSHCIVRTHIYYFCREHDASKINYMYAQYVKNTMEPLNIPDVAKDTRFPWTVSNLIWDLMHTGCFPFRPPLTAAPCLKDWVGNWVFFLFKEGMIKCSKLTGEAMLCVFLGSLYSNKPACTCWGNLILWCRWLSSDGFSDFICEHGGPCGFD